MILVEYTRRKKIPSLLRTQNSLSSYNWSFLNQLKNKNLLKLKSKLLIIYSYSISSNLLKEVLKRLEINFILTTEIRDASIIIGLRKTLIKNTTLTQVANKYGIPIYTFNKISYYQLVKLFSIIDY